MAREAQRFQAKIVGDIACKMAIRDMGGREVQGFKFNIEIAKDQADLDESKLLELLDGNPVVVAITQDEGTKSCKFTTVIDSYASATRTDGEDYIRYLKVPLVAYRREISDPGKLFDLQCEDHVTVSISSKVMELGLPAGEKQQAEIAGK